LWSGRKGGRVERRKGGVRGREGGGLKEKGVREKEGSRGEGRE